MKDLDRRSMLKVLVKGAAASLSIVSIVKCSSDVSILEPVPVTKTDIASIRTLVGELCKSELAGLRLTSKNNGLGKNSLNLSGGLGWDYCKIVESFEVVSETIQDDTVIVTVKYRIIGKISGDVLQENSEYMTVTYKVIQSHRGYFVDINSCPLLSKECAINHLNDLLTSHIGNKEKILNWHSARREKRIAHFKDMLKQDHYSAKTIAAINDRLEKYKNNYCLVTYFENRLTNLTTTLHKLERM